MEEEEWEMRSLTGTQPLEDCSTLLDRSINQDLWQQHRSMEMNYGLTDQE